jgi:hypothetical protein
VNPRFRAKFLQIVGAARRRAVTEALPACRWLVTYKLKSLGVDRAV